ncbi:histidine phosphatase family protein [Ktedonosporobacter rubrisoli]|nr:histidine phosphatase family protein [Ktedonosporobacter rubrisoli]
MRNNIHILITVVGSWFHVLWIYWVVHVRFLRWRWGLWLRRTSIVESTHSRMKRTLLIIRHGQTTWNVEHRLPGQVSGVELNDTGKQQATRLAEALTVIPISALISSPLERARDTAAIVGKGRDLEIQFEPDLMDTDIGPWAGQTIEELNKNDPAWKAYVKDPTVAPEGVETFPQVQKRVVAAIERWCAQDSLGAYPAFVAHADVIKLLIAHYTGLEAGRAGTLMIDNASVSLVELDGENPPHVLAIGWSPHPGWLHPPKLPIAVPTPTNQNEEEAQKAGEQKT